MKPPWTKCPDPAKSTYEILDVGGREQIRFYPCGVESPNQGDVAHRYCAFCHEFIMRKHGADRA